MKSLPFVSEWKHRIARWWEKTPEPLESTLLPNAGPDKTSETIANAISCGRAFLVARLGWVEAGCLGEYVKNGQSTVKLRERLRHHAGVFPASEKQFCEFAQTYSDAVAAVDLLGVMRVPGERAFIEAYARQPLLADLSLLEPYLSASPWSSQLAGKRVLVVHPFADSIRDQYLNRRTEIFADPRVLPEFNLRVLRPPQTIAGNTAGFSSWNEAIAHLKVEVEREEFDVAIIGCGAYGLPIGAHVKSLGRVAIHLGGATQILFGVSGARWRDNPTFQALQTPAWRPPLESERPQNWNHVEGGCYW